MQSEYEALFDAVESFYYSRGEAAGQLPCRDESLMPMHKAYIAVVDAAEEVAAFECEDDSADWGFSDD